MVKKGLLDEERQSLLQQIEQERKKLEAQNVEKRKGEDALQKALEEVNQQKRLYEAVASSTPDLIYVFDLKKKFTFANEALLQMWGKSWDDAIGKGLAENGYEPWHVAMHHKEIDQIIATKKPIRGEVGFPHATLGQRMYDYIFTPVLNDRGEVEAIAGTTRDISELKELSRQKDEFLGIASHELKTPVTSIKAYTQVLEKMFRRKGENEAASQLSKVISQVDRLSSLIEDLLDVTKIQAGKLEFNEEPFDFNELVINRIEELQHTSENHKILIKLGETASVFADKDRIGQVITNLITNAIKYSPNSDKIQVSSSLNSKDITLCIKDFGVGIEKDKQEKVFEQFYRVSGDKRDTFPGLGLGLYISSEIIKREGGRIWVESTKENGCLFSFTLPIYKRHKKIKH